MIKQQYPVYQRCLAVEMIQQWLECSREHEMKLSYKGEYVGTRKVDFFVEGKVMVELKAVVQLEDVHLAQAINYLEAYGLENGLEFKRVLKTHENHNQSKNQSSDKTEKGETKLEVRLENKKVTIREYKIVQKKRWQRKK